MSATIRIEGDRSYHTLVVDEIVWWQVVWGYSDTTTEVHFKDGSAIYLSGNHGGKIEAAVQARKERPNPGVSDRQRRQRAEKERG